MLTAGRLMTSRMRQAIPGRKRAMRAIRVGRYSRSPPFATPPAGEAAAKHPPGLPLARRGQGGIAHDRHAGYLGESREGSAPPAVDAPGTGACCREVQEHEAIEDRRLAMVQQREKATKCVGDEISRR